MEKDLSKKYSVNCMFLGESGVGKTSIINRLLDEGFDENLQSTIGVNYKFYQQIYFENEEEDGSYIAINIWDTAGQEAFHSCINGIIHKADIIVFVRDKDTENFEYWFKFVDQLIDIKSKKVFYCLNKTDLMTNEEKKKIMNEMKTINKNNNHNAYILCVSSKSNDNIDNLQNLLERESQDIISKGLESHKYTIKVLVIGPAGVGKSSLTDRIINDTFTMDPLSTLGVSLKKIKVDLNNHSSINYQYIDSGGQEKYRSIWNAYLIYADIIIFVNDDKRIKAYTNFVEDKILLSEKKIICCINKMDLISDAEKNKVLKEYKLENDELKAQPIFLVSAKSKEGIKELTKKINEYSINIIDKKIDSSKKTDNRIELKNERKYISNNKLKKKKKCC